MDCIKDVNGFGKLGYVEGAVRLLVVTRPHFHDARPKIRQVIEVGRGCSLLDERERVAEVDSDASGKERSRSFESAQNIGSLESSGIMGSCGIEGTASLPATPKYDISYMQVPAPSARSWLTDDGSAAARAPAVERGNVWAPSCSPGWTVCPNLFALLGKLLRYAEVLRDHVADVCQSLILALPFGPAAGQARTRDGEAFARLVECDAVGHLVLDGRRAANESRGGLFPPP